MNEVIEHDAGTKAIATTEHNPYLSMVQGVISAGGDMSSLDKLLDLQIKWEANEARKGYVAAMAAFKTEPMEILKKKLVEYNEVSYKHAELSDVTDAVVPAMAKHGLSHRWDVNQQGGQISVTCTITHQLGHSESVTMTAAPDSSGKKNAIQQVASANSYLQRYTLLAATGMATKGMDDDGRGSDQEPEPEVDVSWYDAIEACASKDELHGRKREMVEKYGKATDIPKALVRAYNARLQALAE